ncbi:ATP-dependent DNA helicase [Spongiibacter taiwanensis]|uniref:ATP-dependent DNA helicase n=1 Tax=Spongiibacter taiwanensis TaxID=1748242 RepID=UPI002035EAC4|nr:ATP-dependent DNA helicase [Spongiibacter taiwanensis]USA43726.1 ATP-dependent DNA helicase [Spongiibacter taiwanensis]
MNVSVRSLCEFAARKGSLDFRYTPSPTALEGVTGHIKVQSRRPDPYVAEYPLSGEWEGLSLGGRVDGYFASKKSPYLEEIKTHRGDVRRIGPGPRGLHWAQLKVYGALFCLRENRDSICLKLTYFDVVKERETSEELLFEAADLLNFTGELCARYRQWAEQNQRHRQQRDTALSALKFPFDHFRRGQRDLSETVYKTISTGRHLLLQAPTGIGKTLGVLYPALLTLPRKQIDRLFFLSCRNTGKQLALDALGALKQCQREAVPLRIVELSAREHACEHPNLACHGESCPLADGFFDRLDGARQAATEAGFLDQPTLRRIALEHQICPYFLGQEMARWSDVTVGDVNHYFDQQALLFALSQQDEWRCLPVVDEAHNLVDRARGMYSVGLSEGLFKGARKRMAKPVARAITTLNKAWRQLTDHYQQQIGQREGSATTERHYLPAPPDELNQALQGLIHAVIDHLSEHAGDNETQQLLFAAVAYLRLAELFGDHSLCSLDFQRDLSGNALPGSAMLNIDNLIPADHLQARFASAHSSVLFSATLSPPDYYRDLLGLPADSHWQDIDSPFSADQLELRVVRHISTRLQHRQQSLAPIAERIARQYQRKPGNYLMYVSSFRYLNDLTAQMAKAHPDVPVFKQTPAMAPQRRQDFIDRFKSGHAGVGFAVLGGVFSEGIDLPGEQLIGVFVATLGLPPFDHFHQILQQRMHARFGNGYEYTYLYPGLRKVIQAAGRLIRSPSDSGVIELIDPRFAEAEVNALLPSWWHPVPAARLNADSAAAPDDTS